MRKITILMVALVVCAVSACGYERYTVHKGPYGEPDSVSEKQVKDVMGQLGIGVEQSNWELVESKVITKFMHRKPRTIEFQVWFKVYLRTGIIKVFCTERKVFDAYGREAAWKFDKCTNPWMLSEIDKGMDAIEYLLLSSTK